MFGSGYDAVAEVGILLEKPLDLEDQRWWDGEAGDCLVFFPSPANLSPSGVIPKLTHFPVFLGEFLRFTDA